MGSTDFHKLDLGVLCSRVDPGGKISDICNCCRLPSYFEMDSAIFTLPSGSLAYYMEKDQLIPGHILFSDCKTLRTTDGNNTIVVHDFWTIDHASILGFVQISIVEIIFVDNLYSCLRLFNRSQGKVYKFAGDCKDRGFRDGTNPLFYVPYNVIQDNQTPCLFYVPEYANRAVRMVTKSRMPHVTTLIRSDYKSYMYIAQDSNGTYLYINYYAGLERYNLITNTSIDIISDSRLYKGYTTNHAMINDINIRSYSDVVLQNDLVVMFDQYMLLLIDLTTNETYRVCTGVAGHRSGNISVCQLNQPHSLLEMDGNVYIGESGVVSVLRGMLTHFRVL